jgi:hypothetical protein
MANILVLAQELAELTMALKQYLQLYLWNTTFIQTEFLVKAHQVNATHKVVNKWSRKARDIINKNHDHWQRALKNPDKTLHTLVKIIACER